MSYSQMQTMAGQQQQLQQSETTPAQLWLRSLVQDLKWSYVALWVLNPQTRKLGWQGGHWRQCDARGWQYFSSIFKACQFYEGYGSTGIAYEKGENVWMEGSSILDKAGFQPEQSEFLQQARISTVVLIPWSDGVVELGTCERLPENPILMVQIREYFFTNILPTLGSGHWQLSASNVQTGGVVPDGPLGFPPSSRALMQPSSYGSTSPMRHHLSDAHSFEPISLNQQIHRRSASMSDMFLAVDAQGKEVLNTNTPGHMLLDSSASWGMPALATTRGLATQPPTMYYPPPVQAQYRSRSGNTSSSVSSLEEAASTRLSGDSPEQNVFFIASSQRQASHSNTSSSPRRGTSSLSPELTQNLEDPIHPDSLPEPSHVDSRAVAEEEIHLDPFLILGEPLESGTYTFPSLEPAAAAAGADALGPMNQLLTDSTTDANPHHHQNQGIGSTSTAFHSASVSLEPFSQLQQEQQPWPSTVPKQVGPFKAWHRNRVLAPPLRKKRQNLLRRCIDMVTQIPHATPPTGSGNGNGNEGLQQREEAQAGGMPNAGVQGRRGGSSSSPETATDGVPNEASFDQVPPRGQRRPRQGSRISTMGGAVHHMHDEAAKNHMLAERRRRVKQKENFAILRKLVPIISKADKASILGDAIVYIEDMQSQIEDLEVRKAESDRKLEKLQNSYKELEQRHKELQSMMRPTRLHSI